MVETTSEVGVRRSRKRTLVHDLVAGLDTFTSTQDIHQLLRQRGEGMGLSTVYRNLQVLAEAREVETLRSEDGEVLYRKCEVRQHHHHLVCRRCGRAIEVQGPAVERWADRAAQDHGFSDVSHTVEIFGVCPACAAREG
jgi:Fur family ferric uptake transcriptional regulator